VPDGRPRIAILCGGRGTRISRGNEDAPKPLVEIGERPILWHVMALYAAQGFNNFLLLTGWRADQIDAAVADFSEVAAGEWIVESLDTGDHAPTGGRIEAAREQLGGGTFGVTYADGLADIDLSAELEFHRRGGGLATIAVTRPQSPWGQAQIGDDDRITGFVEKPMLENWINGGFMFFEDGALDFIGPDDVLEQRPLENLAAAGELRAWRHEGFWDCMDTYKDTLELSRLCAAGTPPWLSAQIGAGEGAL
jgi:glucose-1-phosphate cytidylyltransferase